MNKLTKSQKRVLPQLFGIAAFCILLGLLFFWYRGRLNMEFDQLVQENLTAYAESQHREVQAMIEDVQGTLRAVATMLERSGLDPESQWMTDYLQALGERQSKYTVTYSTMEDQLRLLEEGGTQPEGQKIYERLLRGEEVVSDVRLSRRLGNRRFFSIAIPRWSLPLMQRNSWLWRRQK